MLNRRDGLHPTAWTRSRPRQSRGRCGIHVFVRFRYNGLEFISSFDVLWLIFVYMLFTFIFLVLLYIIFSSGWWGVGATVRGRRFMSSCACRRRLDWWQFRGFQKRWLLTNPEGRSLAVNRDGHFPWGRSKSRRVWRTGWRGRWGRGWRRRLLNESSSFTIRQRLFSFNSLDFLGKDQVWKLNIRKLNTDRHVQITKYIGEEMPNTSHFFEMGHVPEYQHTILVRL